MKAKRPWRTAVKWMLLACAVGVAVLAVGSWWWGVALLRDDFREPYWATATAGTVSVNWLSDPTPSEGTSPFKKWHWWRGLATEHVLSREVWAPTYERSAHGLWVRVPLWIPFVLTFGPFLYMWHTDRKAARLAKRGECPSCGYDRVGLLAGAACPECGTLPKVAAAGGGTT